jgi:hypothetical protein
VARAELVPFPTHYERLGGTSGTRALPNAARMAYSNSHDCYLQTVKTRLELSAEFRSASNYWVAVASGSE